MVTGATLLLVVVAAGSAGVWWWRDLSRPSENTSIPEVSGKSSIAVLPFTNLSGDSQQDYLSDGITEDVITALARFSELSVVARNSTFAYKGKAVDVRQVGRDLGVRYVLEGSVRRSGDRARVTAQLIDASDGTHVWGQSFDRHLNDLFNVQDEVIQQIVGRLDVELDRAKLEESRRRSPQDFKAYDLVLQARKLIHEHSEAKNRMARDLLERAVEMDATFAPAYIELAWVYLNEFRFNWDRRPDSLDRALGVASRAVELEPNSGFAHWRLAKILFFRKEMDRFDAEMQRALELNPNHAETLADVATHLPQRNRWDEAYTYAQRAAKLDPNLSWVYFVHTRYFYRKRQYREALAWALRINLPDLYHTHVWLAVCHAQLGELDAAHREAAEVMRLKPDYAYMDEARLWSTPDDFAAQVAEGARKARLRVWPTDEW
jgi:adenylate cyclase